MAQLVTVKLVRHDSTPWGFRLQGGKDFGTPLLIQKVNGGSLAEQAGLAVGDGLIKVNGQEVFNLKHKDAQDAIVHGGNCLELQVQRGGGSTWKPIVAHVGATPSPLPHVSGPPPFVTKTSLAANKPPGKPIGSGHNVNPKPFNGLPHSQLNGTSNGAVKAIVNKQYNTPVGIYSEETIAETLSAQAEVLATGAIGVNFKKNEKNYNAQNSEVLKMVQEADAEPKSPEPVPASNVAYFATSSHAVGGRATSPRPLTPMAQQIAYGSPTNPFVVAKETAVAPDTPDVPTATVTDPPNCSECGKIVVGVFVRIKDKNLHVECFKCATCGTSLKNVGYYNINNKLYCDIHAKMIARQNPPAPNLEPVTVSPGGRIPSNVISNAVSSAMSPKSNSVSSPFQTPNTNVLSPKSFNGTSAPLTPPISSNFSRQQTVGESKSSCTINSSSWQTYSSGNGLCPSPLPSTPGYVLTTSKSSSPVVEKVNPLFASLPSASKVEPGTNCLSPAPLPSVPGYISPGLPETINPNPLFASLPSASQVKPGTNCLSPAPLPSIPGYVSPVPRSMTPSQMKKGTTTTQVTSSIPYSQVAYKEDYNYSESGNLEKCCQQKTDDECYATPCSIKQLKPAPRTQSPCMWAGSYREVSHSELSAAQSLSCTLGTQLMLKTIKETGRWSPVPPTDPELSRQFPTNLSFTNYETQEPSKYVPPIIRKPCQPTFLCKSTPPPPVISFPPDFDPTPIVREYSRSRSTTPVPTKTYEMKSEIPVSAVQKSKNSFADEEKIEKKSVSEVTSFERPLAVEPLCERKYVAEVTTFVNNTPQTKFDTSFLSKTEERPPGVLPVAMSVEQMEEFHNIESLSLPAETSPYYPESMREKPEPKIFRPEPPPSGSPLLFALTTAPGRCYSPLPSVTKPPTPPPVDSLPDFETELPVIPGVRPVSMLAALTVASERPYSPMPQYPPAHSVSAPKEGSKEEEKKENYILTLEKNIWSPRGVEITLTSEETESYSSDKYVSQNPELKGKQCVKIPRLNSPSRLSFTNSGLHKPSTIPPYQQNIGDGTYTPRARSPQPPHKTPEVSTQEQHSTHPKVTKESVSTPKAETKPLKSCVKSSKASDSGSKVSPTVSSKTDSSSVSSVCKKADEVCCKKVTISEASSSVSSLACQRSVCETSVCERPICAKPACDDPKQNLSKSCPYVMTQAESAEESKVTSSLNAVGKSCCTKQSSSQTGTKQVCAISSSQTCAKKVSVMESHSSTITSATSVSSCSQVKSLSTSMTQAPTITMSSESCLRSAKADSSSTTSSSTCTRPSSQVKECKQRSSEPTQTSSVSPSSCNTCPMSKNKQEPPQPKPAPVTSTKLAHSTSHRLSPLAVSDIPTDAKETSTICKTASGSQIFKPPVSAKPAETKSVPSITINEKQTTTVNKSTTSILDAKQSLTCNITSESRQSKPPVPSIVVQSAPSIQTSKSIPLTQAAAFTPSPVITATPPATPTTVSQSPNSAFSLPRKTNGSVASSLSKTLSAKIAANLNISSSPASSPNTGSASTPNPGAGGTTKGGTSAGLTAPRRGRGVLNPQNLTPGARVPLCGQCHEHIRGPFITALGKIWCPDHFICVNKDCRRPLQDIGFVEESSGLYCEYCFEKYLAPTCHKCSSKIKGDCLNAIGKHFHPECFKCAFCSKLFGNNPFFLEEGLPYCENDWNELFTTKCFACGFPIEAGDRWVEALNNNYHSPCFNCTQCKKNLEGESFYAKGGRPYCKSHAR